MKVGLVAFASVCVLTLASVAGCSGTGGNGAVAPVGNSAPVKKSVHPMATPTPIQLVLGGTIGTVVFPDDDTATGGQGQSIQGINCRKELLNSFHHHVQLSMFVNGEQIALPKGTGMKDPHNNPFIYHAACFYFLHTHDRTGIIHIEPRTDTTYNLKNYFAVWGMPLSTTGFAGYTGAVSVYINGTLQPGMDPRTVTFSPFEQITLVIGTPPDWIPVYIFPAGYT